MVTYESGKAPADAPVTYTTDRRRRAPQGGRMSAPLDLAAMRKRCDETAAFNGDSHFVDVLPSEMRRILDEVERLAAENARLRAVRDAAAAYRDSEDALIEAFAKAMVLDADYETPAKARDASRKALFAALRAAGGG